MRVPQCIVSVPGSVCTAAGRLRFPRFPFGLRFGFMFYILPCLPAERPLRLCCLVRRCVATRVPMDCVCLWLRPHGYRGFSSSLHSIFWRCRRCCCRCLVPLAAVYDVAASPRTRASPLSAFFPSLCCLVAFRCVSFRVSVRFSAMVVVVVMMVFVSFYPWRWCCCLLASFHFCR